MPIDPVDSRTTPPALVCVPGAIDAAERPAHFALAARLFGEIALERRAIDRDEEEGYTFHFDADTFVEVARFVQRERSCCPFLTFTLTLAPSRGSLWLRLTGPKGTREFLDAELLTTPRATPESTAERSTWRHERP